MLRSLPDLPDQLLFEQLGGAKCTSWGNPFRLGYGWSCVALARALGLRLWQARPPLDKFFCGPVM